MSALSSLPRRRWFLLWVSLGAATCCTLQANAGTPLMWAGMLHLLFGNLFIGFLEGSILAHYGAPYKRAITVMILANYISAWVGALVLASVSLPNITIENAVAWMSLLLVATFVATVIIEWPLSAWALRQTKHHGLKSFLPHLCAQACSYLLLVVSYRMIGPTSLLRVPEIVASQAIAAPPGARLYFISPNGSSLNVLDLDGRKVRQLRLFHDQNLDRLAAATNATGGWSLITISKNGDPDASPPTIDSNLPGQIVGASSERSGERPSPTWRNFGRVPRFNTTSVWVFRTGFWASQGLLASNEQRNVKRRLALETPVLSWRIRNATQLPNDQVIFQLGDDQICIYDPNENKLALLARGRGPVVSIEEEITPARRDGF